MKKLKNLLIMGLVCVSVFILTGCDVDYNKVAGNYYLESKTTASVTLTIDELVSGGVTTSADNEVINLSADKTFSFSGIIGSNSGTFVIEDNVITFTTENGSTLATFENEKIVITTTNGIYVYAKRA